MFCGIWTSKTFCWQCQENLHLIEVSVLISAIIYSELVTCLSDCPSPRAIFQRWQNVHTSIMKTWTLAIYRWECWIGLNFFHVLPWRCFVFSTYFPNLTEWSFTFIFSLFCNLVFHFQTSCFHCDLWISRLWCPLPHPLPVLFWVLNPSLSLNEHNRFYFHSHWGMIMCFINKTSSLIC